MQRKRKPGNLRLAGSGREEVEWCASRTPGLQDRKKMRVSAVAAADSGYLVRRLKPHKYYSGISRWPSTTSLRTASLDERGINRRAFFDWEQHCSCLDRYPNGAEEWETEADKGSGEKGEGSLTEENGKKRVSGKNKRKLR